MLSKHFQRQVNALHVFCRHEDRGCEWYGELSDLERHIQSCPMKYAPLKTDILKQFLYVNIIISTMLIMLIMLLSTDINMATTPQLYRYYILYNIDITMFLQFDLPSAHCTVS